MRVRPEGNPFIAGGLILVVVAGLLGWPAVATLFALVTLFIIRFFRDPERKVPLTPGIMVSPADGRVVEVGEGRLAIFMSLLDCHVNRSPVDGEVVDVVHILGKFHPAHKPQAAQNERNIIKIRHHDQEVQVAQVAGLVARRIVSWVKPGDRVERGERMGMILFGSRVEVEVSRQRWRFLVTHGDRVRAGETVVARAVGGDE